VLLVVIFDEVSKIHRAIILGRGAACAQAAGGQRGSHPRGDRKYAQASEGTGDRGVTWRI
jgi:hypothetical protein